MLQAATLEVDEHRQVTRVSVGACSGSGHLGLGTVELATFARPEITFPKRVPIEVAATSAPPVSTGALEPAAASRLRSSWKPWQRA